MPDLLQHEAQAHKTGPWLACAAQDILPKEQARKQLMLGDERVALLISGRRDEEAIWQRQATNLREAGSPLAVYAAADGRYPMMRYLRAFDLVVGAGGYHTVHECRAAGVALKAVPMKR